MSRGPRWIAISLLSLALALPASAADLKADITVRVIYAVKAEAKSFDPALDDIRQELVDLPFTKFRLLDKLEATVAINSTVELQFPGQRSIAVRFLGLDVSGSKEMLSLQLAIKPALNMQMRVADGGRTLLGGPSHLDGTLFLDVTARLQEIGAASKPADDQPLRAKDTRANPAPKEGNR